MESVVEDGSGAGTRIEGYRIAGKTGTSQKAKMEFTQARRSAVYTTLPVENPKYVSRLMNHLKHMLMAQQ